MSQIWLKSWIVLMLECLDWKLLQGANLDFTQWGQTSHSLLLFCPYVSNNSNNNKSWFMLLLILLFMIQEDIKKDVKFPYQIGFICYGYVGLYRSDPRLDSSLGSSLGRRIKRFTKLVAVAAGRNFLNSLPLPNCDSLSGPRCRLGTEDRVTLLQDTSTISIN